MNLKYIKSEIYNLGFSSSSDVDVSIVLQAINRAVDTISNTVRPILSSYKIKKGMPETPGDATDETPTETPPETPGDATDETPTETPPEYNPAITKISNTCKLVDFKEIAKQKGETFISFHDCFELTEDGYVPIGNHSVINRHNLQVNPDKEYLIFYTRMYTPVDNNTPDDFEFELDADLHVLIPLLAAFYVWQDDEERKADKLYNDYEMKRNDIVQRERKVVACVRSDGYGY